MISAKLSLQLSFRSRSVTMGSVPWGSSAMGASVLPGIWSSVFACFLMVCLLTKLYIRSESSCVYLMSEWLLMPTFSKMPLVLSDFSIRKLRISLTFFRGRTGFICRMFQCCHGEPRGEGLNVPGHECANIVIKDQAVFG